MAENKRKIVLDHPRMKVAEDQVRLPNGTITDYLRFPDKNQSVMIICIIEGNVLVEKEYSYPPNEVLYQFPGGAANDGEAIEIAAKREFAEECKLTPNNLTQIGWYYDNNRRSNAKMHVFITTDISDNLEHASDEEEDISFEWIPVATVKEMIREGKIINHAMLAAWALLQNSEFLNHSSQ